MLAMGVGSGNRVNPGSISQKTAPGPRGPSDPRFGRDTAKCPTALGRRAKADFWLPPIQIAEKPPPTDNSTPFTKLASPEARNSATVAISSGRPIFPRGSGISNISLVSLSSRSESGVSTCPGAQHVHPDIPALQFVEPRACELALGSERLGRRGF